MSTTYKYGGCMKILLVDDEQDVLKTIKNRLEKRGFIVVTAGSSSEALRIFETEDVDLILMDIMMPGMSGAEAVSLLQENGKLDVPVIFVTGVFCKENTRGVNVRGRFYPALAKPFTIEELLMEIEKATGVV